MCFRPMRSKRARAARRQQSGYVLVIMLVIVVMGSLYGLLNRLNTNAAESSRTAVTYQALKQARQALLAYAVTYRDRQDGSGFGYLPCPDMAGDDGDPDMIGTHAGSYCGTKGQPAVGLLPYQTLGLPELRDGDGNCLWYIVAGSHKEYPKNTSTLSPSTVADFDIYDPNGSLLVSRLASAQGAAAIVVSPGVALVGQVRGLGNTKNSLCRTDSSQMSAYLESPTSGLISGIQTDGSGNVIKNDKMSWVSASEIFALASQRSDYANNAPSTKTTNGSDQSDGSNY